MFKREEFVIETHPSMEGEFRVVHVPTGEESQWMRGNGMAHTVINNACEGKLLGTFLNH